MTDKTPSAKARRHLPVLSPSLTRLADMRSRIEQDIAGAKITLVLDNNRHLPWLALDRKRTVVGRKVEGTRLLSTVNKMRCASLSLPAGPVSVGGSCPASARVKLDDPGEWVCHGCYATVGQYQMKNVQVSQAIRMAWVRETLASGTFVEQMVKAIEFYRQFPCSHGGVYSNPEFFRIHDSGDFYSTEYARAWNAICERLPHVKFWAPTREWLVPARLEAFRAAPSNLVIRPSAFYVDQPPPDVAGMPAGSSVMRAPQPPVYPCPAYDGEAEKTCEAAGCRTCWTRPGVAVNYQPHGSIPQTSPADRAAADADRAQKRAARVATAEARAAAKAAAARAREAARSKATRENPSTPLSRLWREHLALPSDEWGSAGRPSLENFWRSIARWNFTAEHWPEEEWIALFESQRVTDFDEQAALLENLVFSAR